MECDDVPHKVSSLVEMWTKKLLTFNPEYQRGSQWTLSQQQGLIDSVFRRYPIPPVFLHAIRSRDLKGTEFTQHEVVDGQQRLRALVDYHDGKFSLLDPSDRKLRLPNSLRTIPVAWSGKRFGELVPELRDQFAEFLIRVVEIENAEKDEIRDLFIRLQAGTALTRQQIRDAWPGKVGPFIEGLAGKLRTQPSIGLFKLYDKRGSRSEDDRDEFVRDREFCAQLLRLFLHRETDPISVPPLTANDLDSLYHDQTQLDIDGETCRRFQFLLNRCTQILSKTQDLLLDRSRTTKKRTKFKKFDVFALFMFCQDISRNERVQLNGANMRTISEYLLEERSSVTGKTTSGAAIKEFYEKWRVDLPEKLSILDAKRLFDETDKSAIWERDGGVCQVCREAVSDGDGHYDHYPIAYRDGGRTVPDNGRLVHKGCHPMPGRPPLDD